MIPTKTIQLDFWRHPTDILHLVQGEADGRKIRFKITDNGAAADLTGFIAIFAIKKPDGNVVVNSATVTDAELGTVETTISSQVVTTAGNAHAELHLMKEGQLSKSFRIVTKVAPGVDIDGIAPSVSEFNALQTLIGQAETVISIADTELWPEVVANAQYFSDLAGAGRTTETVKGNAERIDNYIVDPLKTDFIKRGKNLFNPDDVVVGYVVNIITGGAATSSAGNCHSGFIRVLSNTTYTKNYSTIPQVCFYDETKAFIEGVEAQSFTTPENCHYVRFNFRPENRYTMQLEQGDTATEFEEFYNEIIRQKRVPVPNDLIEDNAVSVEKVDFVEQGKNLFNKNTINLGYVVRLDTGLLGPSAAGNSSSDFIRVKPNTDYVKNFERFQQVVFYDKNKEYISSVEAVTFTTPANCYYVRINIPAGQEENIQLETGTQATTYEHFGYHFKYQSLPTVVDNAVGVRFSLSSKTSNAERIDNLTTSDELDNKYPFKEIRLCNVLKTEWDSSIITYDDEPNFKRDGTNGEVMAEIPKHYFKRYIKDGNEYVLLSGTQLDGFELDPVFIENGKELNAIYVGVYDGYVENDKLRSISGVNPSTEYHLTQLRQFAHNQGVGFGEIDYRTVAMLQRLFVVYFADRNSQKMVGSGMVDFPFQDHESTKAINSGLSNKIIVDESTNKRFFQLGQSVSVNTEMNQLENRTITELTINSEGQTEITFDGEPVNIVAGETMIYSVGQKTGYTDSLVSHTGMADFFGGKDGYDAVKFLHMENLWGNVWNELDGIALHYLVPYIGENMQEYTSDVNEMKEKYKPLAYKVPLQESNNQGGEAGEWATYIKNLMYDKIYPAYQIPIEIGDGADSDNHYADPFYSHNEEYEIPSWGGGFDHMIRAGLFTTRIWYTPTQTHELINGGRLIYRPI